MLLHVQQQLIHLSGGNGIESRRGFIAEQYRRFGDDGPRQTGALAHAAGKFAWVKIGKIFQPHQLEGAQSSLAQNLMR